MQAKSKCRGPPAAASQGRSLPDREVTRLGGGRLPVLETPGPSPLTRSQLSRTGGDKAQGDGGCSRAAFPGGNNDSPCPAVLQGLWVSQVARLLQLAPGQRSPPPLHHAESEARGGRAAPWRSQGCAGPRDSAEERPTPLQRALGRWHHGGDAVTDLKEGDRGEERKKDVLGVETRCQ